METMKGLVVDGIRTAGLFSMAPLISSYAPRNLPKMYLNLHLRRYARRLVPFLDPFVTIDIIKKSKDNQLKSSDAYEEVKAYLTEVCSRDALEFCAKSAGTGHSFSLSLREGQEVTDHFDDDNDVITVWWLVVPTGTSSRSKSCLRLMFPQRHRGLIVDKYLPHVCQKGRDLMFVTVDFTSKSSMCSGKLESNNAYEEVKAYLSSRCSRDVLGLSAEGTVQGDSFLLSLQEGHEVADQFNNIALWWSVPPSTGYSEEQRLRLMFPQQHRESILDEYLPHVRREGRNHMFGERRLKLYTNKRDLKYETDDVWSHIDFDHPATFDTIAMPRTEKQKIMDDLENFRRNKDYYRRIGKAWKRGYLLCGPPGTGKSSMVAAMANQLKYDIYDIELTTVNSNSDLRKLLVKTTSKSIIVIEDIDCSLDNLTSQRSNKGESQKRKTGCDEDDDSSSKVTLSGLLNFIDGVWSSAQSGERIIVLTTNFPGKLDQALIRRGRMDVRVEMSYCCFEAFETLARNYLGVGAHPLFKRVKDLLQVVEITPADVAESLLPSQADVAEPDSGAEKCLKRLIDELKNRPKKRRTSEDALC